MAATSGSPPAWPTSTLAPEPSTGRTSTSDIPAIESLDSIPDVPAAICHSTSLCAGTVDESAPSAPLMSKRDMSFTPRRAKAPPRAWERRPAVPFVQRNDGQKIWKRVPLGELGVETTKEISSKREEKERADYVRTVKRLKIGQTAQTSQHNEEQERNEEAENNSDKENTETSQQTIGAVPKPSFSFTFIGTKTEENAIEAGASPRKKVRRTEVLTSLETADGGQLRADETPLPEARLPLDNQESDEKMTSEIVDIQTDEEDSTLIEETDTNNSGQLLSEADSDAASYAEAESAFGQTQLSGKVTNLLEVKISFDVVPSQHGPNGTSFQEELPLSSKTEETEPEDHTAKATDSSVAPFADVSIEPQDTNTEDTVTPESDLERVAVEDPTEMTAELGHKRSLQLPSRTVDDDDTAFLHDFLSRAKAQRAAREMEAQTSSQQQSTTNVTEGPEPRPKSEESNGEAQSSVSFLPSATSVPTLEAPSNEQDQPASPLRRSTRTATIRSSAQAGRNKTLPNPIQLKRANGNEFIFTANKSQGAANIALLTRSNTKRNKGAASSVGERLRQLSVQTDESSQQSLDSTSTDVGISAENNTSKMNTSKKRKREKGEMASKAKKALRWNEEELIHYREPSPLKWAEDDDLESPVETPTVESEAHVARRALQSSTSETSEVPDSDVPAQSEEGSKSRVRRVRRGVAGSVNGTPAPKKRSRDLLLEDEEDVTVQMATIADDATAPIIDKAFSSATATTKKSRMPVPVTTPGKQLRHPTSSNATKHTFPESLTVTNASISSSIQAKAVFEDRSGTAPSSSGRRRLRVRN